MAPHHITSLTSCGVLMIFIKDSPLETSPKKSGDSGSTCKRRNPSNPEDREPARARQASLLRHFRPGAIRFRVRLSRLLFSTTVGAALSAFAAPGEARAAIPPGLALRCPEQPLKRRPGAGSRLGTPLRSLAGGSRRCGACGGARYPSPAALSTLPGKAEDASEEEEKSSRSGSGSRGRRGPQKV